MTLRRGALCLLAGIVLAVPVLPSGAEELRTEEPTVWDEAIRRGDWAAARQALEASLRAEGEDRERLVRLAYVCYLQGETVRARALLERLLEEKPDDVACLLMLADILYRNREWAAARDLYLRLDESHPGLRTVNIRLYELFRFEDRERAHRYYLRSLQLPPTDLAEHLGLPAPAAARRRAEEWGPEAKETAVSNALVRYILSGEGAEVTQSSEAVVVEQTRLGRPRGVRIFRSAKPEKVVARLVGSGLLMALYGLVRLVGRARGRGAEDIVVSSYRNKAERRPP